MGGSVANLWGVGKGGLYSYAKSYLNFDLQLDESDGSYSARVIDSPDGQATHHFSLPFSAMELELLILKMGRRRSGVRSLDIGSMDIPSVKKLGGALYDALFADEVAKCFRASLALAEHEGKGLRIRMNLSGAPTLINIPWELLFDKSTNNYIGLSVNTPIIRKLDLTKKSIRQANGALRVLVMISSPTGYDSLDVAGEWERINSATQRLQDEGRLMLERVEPSLVELQRALRRGEYHVFHYIGHGGFDSQNNDGLLVLEDKDKKGHLVNGQYLGALLHDESTLQLVLLNSCSGGRTSVTDPFAGVGQSLLQKGIPAVIAMQFEITDQAAITFSQEFYAALADGYAIDAAVAEARKMIYAQANPVEWATPVLYTSIDNGSLLSEPIPEELQSLEEQRRLREEAKRQAELKRQEEERKHQAEILPPKDTPSPSKRFAWKTTAIMGMVLMLGIGGFVWKQNSETENLDEKAIEPEMLSIPAGSFTMGCELGRDDVEDVCNKIEVLIKDFETEQDEKRHNARDELALMFSSHESEVSTAFTKALKTNGGNYRVGLGVLKVLSAESTHGLASKELMAEIAMLKDSENMKDPTFRKTYFSAIQNQEK